MGPPVPDLLVACRQFGSDHSQFFAPSLVAVEIFQRQSVAISEVGVESNREIVSFRFACACVRARVRAVWLPSEFPFSFCPTEFFLLPPPPAP